MPEKGKVTTIRFSFDEYDRMKEAAKSEGLDISSYIRRCATLYTREHHPELFERS